MKLLPYLAPLVIVAWKRHAAAAWLLDRIGGPLPRWQLAAFGWLFMVEVAIVCGVLCGTVLAWNWATHERPANRQRKARP